LSKIIKAETNKIILTDEIFILLIIKMAIPSGNILIASLN